MTSPVIDSNYYRVLRSNPLRYHAALDFIRSLADFKPHDLESRSQLFFDVRAVMFFEINARWNWSGKDAQVYPNRIHPGNEKSFLESLDSLPRED